MTRRAPVRSKQKKTRYGIDISYKIGQDGDVGLAMLAIDTYLHTAIRKTVPRVRNHPDSGMLKTKKSVVRDLQYDWSVVRDCFTRSEANKIKKVVQRAGATAQVHPCEP